MASVNRNSCTSHTASTASVYTTPARQRDGLRGRPRRPSRWRAGVVYTLAVLAVWLVQLFLLTDAIVFGMFKWHLNGYVWNLLTTPGGIESMEMGPQATL